MLTVIEKILDPNTVHHISQALTKAQWQDGQATAGSVSGAVKNNQQLNEGDSLGQSIGNRIIDAASSHPTFVSAALPSKIYPPKFNKYEGGETYGTHVDSAIMRATTTGQLFRSDLSATLFLTEPHSYEGGELIIETQYGSQSVKLSAGDLVLYPSSSLHHVTPVTKGARISSFFWIQSMVREEANRTLLFDLDQTIQDLGAALPPDDRRLVTLTGVYHNLLRGWTIV